jgi:hypothetical protein
MSYYSDPYAGYIRYFCLGFILLRGSLKLEFANKGLMLIFMTIIPSLYDMIATAVLGILLWEMPVSVAFTMGTIACPVSPAVLIPLLMNLH